MMEQPMVGCRRIATITEGREGVGGIIDVGRCEYCWQEIVKV